MYSQPGNLSNGRKAGEESVGKAKKVSVEFDLVSCNHYHYHYHLDIFLASCCHCHWSSI
jgi:hypothetical protein